MLTFGLESNDLNYNESREKPVFFKGRAYIRVGKSKHQLSASEIRKMAKESGERVYWDEKICEGTGLNDIDKSKVRWFLREARKQRGLKIPEDTPLGDALKTLNLLKNGKPTNACMLLFSKEPKYLQSEVKCIRFSGNEPVKPYIDFQTLDGNVFDMIDKAEDFVLRNIRKAIWLVPGQVQREEKYEYPPDAIREAIINAVVHRDYESPSKVQVRVFDSSIELWNPGVLPSDITIEDLKKEHRSVPRNPLLFKQLFWVKYVEDVGGGTLDMIRQCREWGILEPEFKIITGAFVVVFRLPLSTENMEKLGLNDRQIKAVDYVGKKGAITNKEYMGLTGASRITATRDLTVLVEKGVFRIVGRGKRDIKYILLLRHNDAKMMQK
ncbi:MAG: ATP-binding protein [Pseudomonadota bacterium]